MHSKNMRDNITIGIKRRRVRVKEPLTSGFLFNDIILSYIQLIKQMFSITYIKY